MAEEQAVLSLDLPWDGPGVIPPDRARIGRDTIEVHRPQSSHAKRSIARVYFQMPRVATWPSRCVARWALARIGHAGRVPAGCG